MRNLLVGGALAVAAVSAFAQTTRTAAEEAAAVAKAQAETLEYLVRAGTAQRALDNAEKKAAADAEKAAQEAADKRLADAQAAKKALLDQEKAEQELADKRQAALSAASKSLSEMSAGAAVKDVAVSGTPIEAKTLAYRALGPIARQLALEVAAATKPPAPPPPAALPPAPLPVPTSFILADQVTLENLIAAQVAEESLGRLAKTYGAGVTSAEVRLGQIKDGEDARTKSGGAVVLALEGIKALASVIQTFQTTMSTAPHDIAIDPLALQAALAKAWRDNPTLQSAPLVAQPGLSVKFTDTRIGKSMVQLAEALDRGVELQDDLQHWLATHKAAPASAPPAAAKTKPKAAPDAEKLASPAAIDEVGQMLASLKAASARVADVLAGLYAPGAAQSGNVLTQLIRARHLSTGLDAGAALLSVKVVAAGGNTLATNNLWVGSKLFHSGGAVVAYTLVNKSGNLAGGGVLDSHTGYLRLKRSDSAGLGNSWDPPKPASTADFPVN